MRLLRHPPPPRPLPLRAAHRDQTSEMEERRIKMHFQREKYIFICKSQKLVVSLHPKMKINEIMALRETYREQTLRKAILEPVQPVLSRSEMAENYVTIDEFHKHLQAIVDKFYHHEA